MIRAMHNVVATVIAIRFALSTRRDLLLEILALRHRLAVLARSNRRFRPSDRLLWLILRRMWPRWRGALPLVQPATVDRWHREPFDRRWWQRSQRPGRPRVDAQCRDLIERLAEENPLWGAPRIHGELLKLGIVVSERTVSRYLSPRKFRNAGQPRRNGPQCLTTPATGRKRPANFRSGALQQFQSEGDELSSFTESDRTGRSCTTASPC
jgi:hypothetical protein